MFETFLPALTVVLTIVLIYYAREQSKTKAQHIDVLQEILSELRGKESYIANNAPLLMHSKALGSVFRCA